MKSSKQLAQELAETHPDATVEELKRLAEAESNKPGFAAEVIKEHMWIQAKRRQPRQSMND